MRILLINPNISADTTAAMAAVARDAGPPDLVLDAATAPFGHPIILDDAMLATAADAVGAVVRARRGEALDGIVVSAFGDPGLPAARALAGCPVTGIAEAGMAEAASGGRRFAVATTTPRLAAAIASCAQDYGHGPAFRGVFLTDGDARDLMADPGRLEGALDDACRRAAAAGAECVVIGGGPLAAAARALAVRLPVPIVEPVPAAIRLAVRRARDTALARGTALAADRRRPTGISPLRGGRPVTSDNPLRPVLDHVVVNVLDRLDEVAAQYTRLGFSLTARGHHTLGSSNNLAIFETDYLELLGFLPGRQTQRADLWAHPSGLTGLVFKSSDPDLVHRTLLAHDVPVLEPMDFSRPVELPGGAEDARFTVVRVAGDVVQNGRTFFCHHHTPDLVWRPEWQRHPNGATGIAEFVILGRDPSRTAAVYGRMFGPDLLHPVDGGLAFRAGHATVSVLTPQAAVERFGGALPDLPDGSDRMAALVFRTSSIDAATRVLGDAGAAYAPFGAGVIVGAPLAGNVALAFVGA